MELSKFLNIIINWAKKEKLIIALGLVGSYARGEQKENSDIDLVLICRSKAKYLDDLKWIYIFGNVKKYQREYYGRVTSIRVWYDNDHEIEFGFTEENWAETPMDQGTQKVVKDGIDILYDPEGLLIKLKNLE